MFSCDVKEWVTCLLVFLVLPLVSCLYVFMKLKAILFCFHLGDGGGGGCRRWPNTNMAIRKVYKTSAFDSNKGDCLCLNRGNCVHNGKNCAGCTLCVCGGVSVVVMCRCLKWNPWSFSDLADSNLCVPNAKPVQPAHTSRAQNSLYTLHCLRCLLERI